METRNSTDITHEIAKAETRLAQIEPALTTIAAEQKRILSNEIFDDRALSKLEEQEKTLIREATHQRRRIELLIIEREKAETHEAQTRLDALPGESEELAVEFESARARLTEALAIVLERVRDLADVQRRYNLIVHQGAYLDERYEGTGRHALAPLPTPPNFLEITNELLSAYVSATGEGRLNEWQQRIREWTNSGRRRPTQVLHDPTRTLYAA